MKRRRRERHRDRVTGVNERCRQTDSAGGFTVGEYGQTMEWSAGEGWTRSGTPFTPDHAPISDALLELLDNNNSPPPPAS